MLKTVNYSKELMEAMIKNRDSLDQDLIIEQFHKRLGHKYVFVDQKIDPNGVSMIVEWPNKGKIVVMIRLSRDNDSPGYKKITEKHIFKLSKAMNDLRCDRGIIYTADTELPPNFYKQATENKIELVDLEDLYRLARQIDTKSELFKEELKK